MGMMQQVLAPGVQHRQKADLRSQMPGIGSDLLQRLGHCPEQQTVADPLVLQCQWRKLFGEGKDDVTTRHGEQFLGPLCEPLIPGCGLTLGTMPIAARVVGDEAMRALVAFLDVAAQSGSAAGADVTESFPLL
jgi:hypothetical protein